MGFFSRLFGQPSSRPPQAARSGLQNAERFFPLIHQIHATPDLRKYVHTLLGWKDAYVGSINLRDWKRDLDNTRVRIPDATFLANVQRLVSLECLTASGLPNQQPTFESRVSVSALGRELYGFLTVVLSALQSWNRDTSAIEYAAERLIAERGKLPAEHIPLYTMSMIKTWEIELDHELDLQ